MSTINPISSSKLALEAPVFNQASQEQLETFRQLEDLFDQLIQIDKADPAKRDELLKHVDEIIHQNLDQTQIDAVYKHIKKITGRNLKAIDFSKLSKEEASQILEGLKELRSSFKDMTQNEMQDISFRNTMFAILFQTLAKIQDRLTEHGKKIVNNQTPS